MSNKVKIKILRSDGREFIADGSVNGEASWGITAIEGIGSLEFENFTEKKAVGDGDIIKGTRVKSREISIVTKAKNAALNKILRREAISFFNNKYSFRLYVTYQGETMWIDGIIEGLSIPNDNLREQQRVDVSFFCKDPYMKSVDAFGYDIAAIDPLWTFEEIDDPDWGEPFDSYNFAKSVDITNDGDVETYCTSIIRATGEVKNPKFIHNDAYIRFIDDLVTNDVVEIDIENRKVLKNGKNALAKIDRNSNFVGMVFPVGDNVVSYDADSGETNMSVTLYFNKLYMGV